MRFKPNNSYKPDCFMAGLYGRLSDEDRGKIGKFMESASIINQRDYLHYTVEQLNSLVGSIPIEIFEEYYDDDYTGITFQRPGFQRMMKDLEVGRIDCIIVKDFSRFGRDYIRIIEYLEKDFEKKCHEVRFIAFSDHYDSLMDKPDIGVRILLFLNEEYSRSQSHKVTTGMESMMRAGKYVGAFAPYGYVKDPRDKHHFLIDEEVYENVREVFRLNLYEGLGTTEIAKRLNDNHIDPPAVYKEKKGSNYKCTNRISSTTHWTADTIHKILLDEKYTGTMVQHKIRTKDFKKKKMELVPKEDWIRVSNTHEAIVSKSDFDAVQQLHKDISKNKNTTCENGLFAGVLKCGDCNHALIKHSEKYKESVYHSYECRVHKRDSTKCYTNRINDGQLTRILLNDLNEIIHSVKDLEAAVLKYKASDISNNRKKEIRATVNRKREALKSSQALLEGVEIKWLLDKLSDEKYKQLKEKYENEVRNVNYQIATLENSINITKNILSNKWINSLLESGYVEDLSREIVVELVDSIYVYHDNTLEINYKLINEEKIPILKQTQDMVDVILEKLE